MEALIRDRVGCTIHDAEWKDSDLEKFKAQSWEIVWFRDQDGSIRFPETKNEELKEQQREEFEELSKKGEIICLTDLFINAGM